MLSKPEWLVDNGAVLARLQLFIDPSEMLMRALACLGPHCGTLMEVPIVIEARDLHAVCSKDQPLLHLANHFCACVRCDAGRGIFAWHAGPYHGASRSP